MQTLIDGLIANTPPHIELTPVRAGLVPHTADYPWSSYACNALGEDAGILTPHAKYMALGMDEQFRRWSYRQLLERLHSPERIPNSIVAHTLLAL